MFQTLCTFLVSLVTCPAVGLQGHGAEGTVPVSSHVVHLTDNAAQRGGELVLMPAKQHVLPVLEQDGGILFSSPSSMLELDVAQVHHSEAGVPPATQGAEREDVNPSVERLMRRNVEDALQVNLAMSSSGKLSALHGATAAVGSTLTTTLSSMSSTPASALALPPAVSLESLATSPTSSASMGSSQPVRMDSLDINLANEKAHVLAEDGQLLNINHDSHGEPYPPNSRAAFHVTQAGLTHFNGVYMPTLYKVNNTALEGCTGLVWELINGNVYHILYSHKDSDGKDWWALRERDKPDPAYEGQPNQATCAPEKDLTSWASLSSDAGVVPFVVRVLADDYTSTPVTTSTPCAGCNGSLVEDEQQEYVVVDNAGMPGFNGIYSAVKGEKGIGCATIFGKNGDTEYVLKYGAPMWYFQTTVGNNVQRPYFGQETTPPACEPWNIKSWISSKDLLTSELTVAIADNSNLYEPPMSTASQPASPPNVMIATKIPATTASDQTAAFVRNRATSRHSGTWFRLYLFTSSTILSRGVALSL